ncbi:unnamed protein product [Rotaria sordida]|uniref:Major facilitator superfamily (MFS) profile domain-containing protein n=1 Tax=Rotaria sordida TaxID=392033 RepID=A0A815KTK1_9BILA|nr:unnamed protein product [Rotaria sordida]
MIEFSAGIVSLYYVYGAAEPEHRCRLPSQIWPNDNQFNPINAQHEACLRQYIPMENGRWDQCHIFNLTISNKSLIDCPNGWVFDRSVFLGLTFTEEASLVCHAKAKKSWLSTLMQMAGFALLIIGVLADRFGRKAIITTVSLLLLTICLSMQIVMQWIPISINLKFGLLLTNQFAFGLIFSTVNVAFVLMLELTTSTYRSIAGSIASYCFAFGGVLITLFAYLTRHWQTLLWTVTAFIGLSFPYLYYIPESPLHLYSTKQYSKLETLLRRIAKTNGRTDSECRLGAIIAPVIDSSVVEQYLSLTFYVYGSVALAVLLLILLLPETKNVSLGDTDDNTNNKDGTQIIVSPPVNIGDIEI